MNILSRLSSKMCALLLFALPVCSYAVSVTITSPSENALIQHNNGVADIVVNATAAGVPLGGGVVFILDLDKNGGISARDYSTPYSFVFPAIGRGEHTIDAYIVDSSGNRLTSNGRISHIGVGDIVVAVGDLSLIHI